MQKVGNKCNLSELKVEQKAKIIALQINNKDVKRHLLDMGLTTGTTVKIKKIAPMGDPVDIELRGYELVIGKKDLEQVIVEVIK